MKTIYVIKGGGQLVRQCAQNNQPVPIQRVEKSTWPNQSGCDGQDHYAGALWATDLATVKRWATAWASGYGSFKYIVQ